MGDDDKMLLDLGVTDTQKLFFETKEPGTEFRKYDPNENMVNANLWKPGKNYTWLESCDFEPHRIFTKKDAKFSVLQK